MFTIILLLISWDVCRQKKRERRKKERDKLDLEWYTSTFFDVLFLYWSMCWYPDLVFKYQSVIKIDELTVKEREKETAVLSPARTCDLKMPEASELR